MVKSGFNSKVCRKKIYLSGAHKQNRLAFARDYVDNDLEFFRNILWSDEFTVKQVPNRKFETYWTRPDDSHNNEITSVQKQQGGFSVCFWGAISFWTRSRLVAFEGTVDRFVYLRVLQQQLWPIYRDAEDDIIFMHDNAPIHTSELIDLFLSEKGIDVLNWPKYSPDLNPIENMWAIVKRKLYEKYLEFTSKEMLIDAVFEIWENIEDYIFHQLSEGVPERLQAVIERKGNWINK